MPMRRGRLGTAIVFIKQIEKFDVEWVEQPTPAKDLYGLARVRRAVRPHRRQPHLLDFRGRAASPQGRRRRRHRDRYVQTGGFLTYKKAVALCEARDSRQPPFLGRVGNWNAAACHVVASSPPFLTPIKAT